MKPSIFIDGAAGTTGLGIRVRLEGRKELRVIAISDSDRKDLQTRSRIMNEADLVLLCLPDDAAREAATAVRNPAVRVIDASTAHRVAPGWVYGFPELESDRRESIATAKRVSNPGCYATGFLALVRPLIRAGLLPPDHPLTCNAISGYSGGGRAMIEEFEDAASPCTETVVRSYALGLAHKHVAEMQRHSGLSHPPVFSPAVGRFYRGMMVEVPLQLWSLPGAPTIGAVHAVLDDSYRDEPLVEVASLAESLDLATLDVELLKNTDRMKLFVFGNDRTRQARLIATLDNLGKGASGAAVQSLNLMLGLSERAGLS